jgi:hypothetical protein
MVPDWTAAFAGEVVEAGLDVAPILEGVPDHLPAL